MKKKALWFIPLILTLIFGVWFMARKDKPSLGTIAQTADVKPFGDIKSSKPYEAVRIESKTLSVDDYLSTYNKNDTQTNQKGIRYNRQNITGMEISAMIPEGYELTYNPNKPGFTYYVNKDKNITIGIVSQDSTLKAEYAIQGEMTQHLYNFTPYFSGWLDTLNFYHRSFSGTIYNPYKDVFVYHGEGGDDYIELNRAGVINRQTIGEKKLLRYIEYPDVQFSDKEVTVDFANPPFVQYSYAIVASKIVVVAVTAPNDYMNEGSDVAKVVSESLGNAVKTDFPPSIRDYIRVGSLHFPINSEFKKAKQSIVHQSGLSKTYFSIYEDEMGNPDLTTTTEFAVNMDKLWAKPNANNRQDMSDSTSYKMVNSLIVRDWEITIYEHHFVGDGTDDYLSWIINPSSMSGITSTFYNKKSKQLIVMDSVSESLTNAYLLNDFLINHIKE